jgi:hypothetical protein
MVAVKERSPGEVVLPQVGNGEGMMPQMSTARHVTTMTLDDAEHYSAEDKKRIAAQYPDHERDTRTKGVPSMGSGRVFLVNEDKRLLIRSNAQAIG